MYNFLLYSSQLPDSLFCSFFSFKSGFIYPMCDFSSKLLNFWLPSENFLYTTNSDTVYRALFWSDMTLPVKKCVATEKVLRALAISSDRKKTEESVTSYL